MSGIKPRKSILLIDDEASIQELVQACLSDLAGWTVITVSSAQEGLKRLAVERPDAILLDILMPGMNGTTFIHTLHENPATRSIPVILLSVQARYFTPQKLRRLGVVDAIAKPFNPVTLPETIAQALGWHITLEDV
ncbi:MAG: response regulator [Tildeniella nuda ZEHNDER 1965/U140]|jgi:CheY-like chemotaxis protein|nr:response regulator [Tildeniella nuda ZEHNDER 1965/U140]